MKGEHSLLFHIGPIWFDGTVLIMCSLVTISIICFCLFFTRKLEIIPNKKQNIIEYIIDFSKKIVESQIAKKEADKYTFLSFNLLLFIFFSNMIGLMTKIVLMEEITLWKSPTSDPIVTLSLSMMVIVLVHSISVKRLGIKSYLINSYLRPVPFLLPLKIMEEVTNLISLGLRLYGNIFSGEVILTLISSIVKNDGLIFFPFCLILELVWISFSTFIGGIQAYIFVTLTMAFLNHKIE